MKKVFLLVLSCFVIATIYSQNNTKDYTVSGGILGAVNASEFMVKGNNPTKVDYNLEAGWSVGGWLNIPLANRFSIEPQLMYSSYGYHANTTTPLLLNDGRVRYISLPLFLKLHAGDKVAITAGPQIDFFSSFEDDEHSASRQDDNFKQTSFSVFGGLEIFPHGGVTIFGRYIHGLSDMDVTGTFGDDLNYRNQVIQAGLKLRLFGKPKPVYQATATPVILDTDGDGINDDVDKCPNEKGTAKYNGCPVPDTDGDGINDDDDKCPNEKGIAKYNGCPIPDTDKDGINDEEDKCPNQAGPASNNGCPILDRDKDGINDDVDKCPDVPGVAKNDGCPDTPEVPAEVSKALAVAGQSIYFSSNSAKLASTSTTSINKIVTVMKDNPDLKIKIEGHADNVEKDADNKLSDGRATAVKTYIVSKGISADRVEVEGKGSTMPIGDNNTTAGRTKNRRVEIKANY